MISTVDELVKPLPVTCMEKAEPPAYTVAGETDDRIGTGVTVLGVIRSLVTITI